MTNTNVTLPYVTHFRCVKILCENLLSKSTNIFGHSEQEGGLSASVQIKINIEEADAMLCM
jgi:hypothetical protein